MIPNTKVRKLKKVKVPLVIVFMQYNNVHYKQAVWSEQRHKMNHNLLLLLYLTSYKYSNPIDNKLSHWQWHLMMVMKLNTNRELVFHIDLHQEQMLLIEFQLHHWIEPM